MNKPNILIIPISLILVPVLVHAEFITKDPHEGDVMNPPSLHKYIYAYQNPTRNIDPDGREAVVVSGQPGEHMTVPTHFLTNGLERAKELKAERAKSGEPTTWIIYKGKDSGYNQADINKYSDEARKLGINVSVTGQENDVVSYINHKDGGNSRAKDKITNFTYVGHGLPNNVAIDYNPYEDRPGLDIDAIQSDAFASGSTVNLNASCNAATTKDGISSVDQFASKVDSHSTVKGVVGTVDFRTPEADTDQELLIDGKQRSNEDISWFKSKFFPDPAYPVEKSGTSDIEDANTKNISNTSTTIIVESNSGPNTKLKSTNQFK